MTKPSTPATPQNVRSTTAVWATNDAAAGTSINDDVSVLYYSPTIKELRETKLQMEQYFKDNPGEPFYLSEILIKRIHSLPDFHVGVGQPNELTLEWLESQDLLNLNAVNEAIKADIDQGK